MTRLFHPPPHPDRCSVNESDTSPMWFLHEARSKTGKNLRYGTFNCMVRLSESRAQQNLIAEQLETYRAGHGGFLEEMASDLLPQVPPVFCWTWHGSQCPELQKFAIKILGQICSSNLRHKLRKGVSHAK